FAHMAVPMMSIGYTKELEPALNYFVDRQNGTGSHSVNIGPSGSVNSMKGCYVGNLLFWMNETGSALWALAEEYRYSPNLNGPQTTRPSILGAWNWIQEKRARPRFLATQGPRKISYALLPAACRM